MSRELWAVKFRCPSCEAEHYAEYEGEVQVIEPERLGMAALCGSCEARRRSYLVGAGAPRALWTESDTGKAWHNLRAHPQRYRMEVWPCEDHGGDLRDDRQQEIMRIMCMPPKAPGYPLRWVFRWTEYDLIAQGIGWPIPPKPEAAF